VGWGHVVSGSSSTSELLRPDRELLTAWLLLFLARGSGYGYGLGQQLREEALDAEMTVAYRVLRALERDGHVSSRWIQSSVGPRRRLYSLTAAGRRWLDALVLVVAQSGDRYCIFVDVYEHAGRHSRALDAPSRRSPPSDAAAVRHPEHELMTGWVLLLLSGSSSYGYEMRRRLGEHDVKADPSKLYRLLRRLDADGLLRSHWSDPASGPRRRVYDVTAKGRCGLHEIAGLMQRVGDMHDAFVEAYERVDDDCRGPAIPSRKPRSSTR